MADKPALSEEEIEITPKMIEAGSTVVCKINFAFADEEFWAAEVYQAMAALAPSLAASQKSSS